jgi:CHAT domain-containing protein
LSAAFVRDRAKSVIASLWNVNDASTALLMQQFYKNLAKGMAKAEALRQVQLQFIKGELTSKDADRLRSDIDVQVTDSTRQARPPNFTHPYYWAPFILIGNSL